MVRADLARRARLELPGWRVEGEEIVGRWRFPDFSAALGAAVKVGGLADRANHHPELRIAWGLLEVRLTTHSANALTERDLDLAAAIQAELDPPRA
jgi:4a-hydroxytetrahydrobiopterin dehydratase